MAAAPLTAPPIVHPPRDRTASWPLADRIAYWLCWGTGVGICLIAAAIVVFMLVKGLSALDFKLFVTSPAASLVQSQSGGFLDPIIGTLIVTAIGFAISAPLGIGLAAWLTEYGRPAWLARAVESAIETIAGIPSIVLAIFGLIIFSQSFLGFLSQRASDGTVTAQSFLTAGAILALLALPLIVAATREALTQLPGRLREGSYALGKTRFTTIRTVLLPAIRPSIASGIVLGIGRIIGDTAIIVILLGKTLKNEPTGSTPLLGTLRGTGSTLTSYVYENSPAGEGNAPQKAYAAAFVLLLIVLLLNASVTRLTTPEQIGPARKLASWLSLRFRGGT
ncbi:MAG TPA: ABC transporter permease subunit [Solirubrobacteraceae bacterium]|jgi:phosphate transport system permease protein|nr:ABC transporter permease subunit [Solirubrobacteraceae bacterium]